MKNVIARPVKQYVKGPSDCKQNNIVCFYFLEKSRIGIRFLFPALDNEVKKWIEIVQWKEPKMNQDNEFRPSGRARIDAREFGITH